MATKTNLDAKAFLKEAKKLARPFRITDGQKFRLKDVDPKDTLGIKSVDKPRAQEALARGVQLLAKLQDKLYAQDRWAVLLIFQAMDAAGKDSVIDHVMSGVNPQGCQVYSFKVPSSEDLDHDFLWRCVKCLPERGRIGIFNRSYYEETLVVRVHADYLTNEKLPASLITKDIWDQRFADIRNFERYLANNGTVVRKFFLHVSKAEQKKRFLERIDNPEKNWKFSFGDVHEREHWEEYMHAYQETIRQTATEYAPWYVVPADNKWFTRMVVASAVIEALDSLELHYPKLGKDEQTQLAAAKQALQGNK
ncbi:MAG TPA: polyphosphate kinase 2 family protein [Pyrinomonadaceae bacterium]|nr:polyphosphate kinase 2 family protein [Pyrinomonadaceae bacterium]